MLSSGTIDGNAGRVAWVVPAIIVLGAALGAVNGAAVVLLRCIPLIVTLGMGAVLQGLTLLYSLTPPGSVPDGFDFFAYGRLFGVPVGATVALALFVLTALFLRYHRYGRYIYAVGARPRGGDADGPAAQPRAAARLWLLRRVRRRRRAGSVSRFGVGQPYAGYNFTLGSITPVVVGGTLLSGGVGGVMGTLLGTYLIGLIYNVLNYMGISTEWQLMVQGLVVILAVSVYVERRKSV